MYTSCVNNSPSRQREFGWNRSPQTVRKSGRGVGSSGRVQDAEATISLVLLVTIVLVLVFQAIA